MMPDEPTFTDQMTVRLLNVASSRPDREHWRAIVDRARVSMASSGDLEDDRTLLENLMEWKHLKPFAAVCLYWELELPLFVLWQLRTHEALDNCRYDEFVRDMRNGIEQSRRYCKSGFEFYIPESLVSSSTTQHYINHAKLGTAFYNERRKLLAGETARLFLPAYGLMTRVAFDCDLKRFLWGMCTLRMHRAAQAETRELVTTMYERVNGEMPYVCELFEQYALGD